MRRTIIVLSIVFLSSMLYGCSNQDIKIENFKEETSSLSDTGMDEKDPQSAIAKVDSINNVVAKEIKTEGFSILNTSMKANPGKEILDSGKIIEEDIRSGYFKIDGDLYKLPMAYQDFVARGWGLVDPAYAGNELAPGDVFEMVSFRKGSAAIKVKIGNAGDEKVPLPALSIIEIEINQECIQNSEITIELPKGIILSKADLSDLVLIYGEADYSVGSRPSAPIPTVFIYTPNADMGAIMKFEVDEDSNIIKSFTAADSRELWQKREQLRAAGSQDSEPTPKVSAYQVPAALGTDITNCIIALEGDLYRFPIPVSALEKNGWKLSVTFPSEVEPGGFAIADLSRGTQVLSFGIFNLEKETTTHQNCFIDALGTGEYPFKMAAGIQVGSSRKELLEAIEGTRYEFMPEYLTDEDRYCVFIENTNRFIQFDVSNSLSQVTSIYISMDLESN